MKKIIILLLSALLLTSCGPHYVDYFPYHDDGIPKPSVALLPVHDTSNCNEQWETNELTNCIRFEIMDMGELYLLSNDEIQCAISHMGKNADWFLSDAAFAQEFPQADFVAIVEIVGQQAKCLKTPISKLTLSARIKLVEIRRKQPRVILQEVVSQDYLVSLEQNMSIDQEPYPCTSIGKAHRAFATFIARHLEASITCSY